MRTSTSVLGLGDLTIDADGTAVMGTIETELYQLMSHQLAANEATRTAPPAVVKRAVKYQACEPLGKANPLVCAWNILVSWIRTIDSALVLQVRMVAV